ncbi:hypothetical protein ACIPLC_13675 [Kitasatospora sp. NPDC086801]|uniref:hypothetical protein n=1 Tax=Kitasatospora sp. NPDC086801 TaxID=3364066 RepID=UPI0038179CCF
MRAIGGRWVLPVTIAVAVAATGAVGYLDWRGHRPVEPPGRAAYLCGLRTGDDTPLGRLLPPGGQDVEEKEEGRSGDDPVSCSIRVDGRTALTVSSALQTGAVALSPEAAKHPDARRFDAGGAAASWPGGATASDYCQGGPAGHAQLVVIAGEAARPGTADRQADLEQIARDGLKRSKKDVCQ